MVNTSLCAVYTMPVTGSVVRDVCGRTLWFASRIRYAFTASGVSDGLADSSRATAPLVTPVAMLVPLSGM